MSTWASRSTGCTLGQRAARLAASHRGADRVDDDGTGHPGGGHPAHRPLGSGVGVDTITMNTNNMDSGRRAPVGTPAGPDGVVRVATEGEDPGMSFELPAHHREILGRAREVGEKVRSRATEADAATDVDPVMLEALRESGLAALTVAGRARRRVGAVDSLAVTVVREAFGGVVGTPGLAVRHAGHRQLRPRRRAASERVQQEWLPRVVSLEAIAALCAHRARRRLGPQGHHHDRRRARRRARAERAQVVHHQRRRRRTSTPSSPRRTTATRWCSYPPTRQG